MGSFSASEILTILVIMLIIFGPRRLPEMARKAGEWTARARRAARELQESFREEYQEEAAALDDLRRNVGDIKRDLGTAAKDLGNQARSLDAAPPAAKPSEASKAEGDTTAEAP